MPSQKRLHSTIVDFVSAHLFENNAADSLLFHITVNMKPNLHRAANPSSLLSQFDGVFRTLIRQLVGRNYHRKPHLQPRALVAFDRIGSKRDRTAATTLDDWPHLHVVMTLTPHLVEHLDDAEIELIIMSSVVRSPIFEEPHIQMKLARRSDVQALVSYALKDTFRLEASANWGDVAYDLWPRLKLETGVHHHHSGGRHLARRLARAGTSISPSLDPVAQH